MAFGRALELRVEIYSNGPWDSTLVPQISAALSRRWTESWDVKVPPQPTLEHPAEWRAVVPLPDGSTPESLHRLIDADLLAVDPSRSLRFRTRWAFQESPNHQEVYEVRWTSSTG
ncbi:MAG: hypothetical protein WBF81_00140 [Thermoplasmata archaeon]